MYKIHLLYYQSENKIVNCRFDDCSLQSRLCWSFQIPEKQRLNKYMYMLLRTTQKNKLAIVVTNQIQSNPDGDFEKSMPLGGRVMLYASTHIVHMRRLKLDNHQVELYIGPRYPRKVIDFVIDQRGVVNDFKQAPPLRRRI